MPPNIWSQLFQRQTGIFKHRLLAEVAAELPRTPSFAVHRPYRDLIEVLAVASNAVRQCVTLFWLEVFELHQRIVANRCQQCNSESLHHVQVAGRYLLKMDTRAIRAVNLKAIAAWETEENQQPLRGLHKVIAARLPGSEAEKKRSEKYLYQLLKGYKTDKDKRDRTPGPDLCKRLEQGYGLPENWMSQQHAEPIEEIKQFWALRDTPPSRRSLRVGEIGPAIYASAWPFPGIDVAKVRRLSAMNIARLEGAMAVAATHFGLDIVKAAA